MCFFLMTGCGVLACLPSEHVFKLSIQCLPERLTA
uniref:Uncharacterized protein n=1 Tax=Anguilla anguilla TaxID=7936 RepID=A0A0E9TYS2_ANGAN